MEIDRYHRQTLLPQIGPEGRARLARARVLLVGCGALGCVIAEQLARAGVGELRIADRDLVELTNLQRQVLFDERDAAEQAPKAAAAARRLRQINSRIAIEPLIVDVHAGNVEQLVGAERGRDPVDLVLDGTDNVETRYLLNDVAIKHAIPWVYGACVGTEGRCMAVRPGQTACLRCLFPEPPSAGELPTCDTAGVLGPAAAVAASLQVTAALRILVGAADEPQMVSFDLWRGRFKSVSTADARRAECVACGQRRFEFLDERSANRTTSLCGRDAVQVRPPTASSLDLAVLADRLGGVGDVQRTPYLLRCQLREPGDVRLTIFPDGRAIIHGIRDVERARSLYARFVGA